MFSTIPRSSFLFGDPGNIGNDFKYIVRHIGKKKINALTADLLSIRVYNQLHDSYHVHVEWRIGGIKKKWQRLSTRFDSTTNKFVILFYAAALTTNFLKVYHARR